MRFALTKDTRTERNENVKKKKSLPCATVSDCEWLLSRGRRVKGTVRPKIEINSSSAQPSLVEPAFERTHLQLIHILTQQHETFLHVLLKFKTFVDFIHEYAKHTLIQS